MADIKIALENKLARGQVWYWEDPVYLDKKKSLLVDKDEYTLRYSRYVLVVQDPDSIQKDSVLVAPLTSTDNRKEDVEVMIDPKQLSYIRLDKIMPICSQNLIRYVCTLSAETMDCVDAMVMKLTLPHIYYYMRNAGYKAAYKYERTTYASSEEEFEVVKNWFNKNVFYDAQSSLSIESIYQRYISDDPSSKLTFYQFITIINQLVDNSNSQRRILVLMNSKLLPKDTKLMTNEEKVKKEAEKVINETNTSEKKEEGEKIKKTGGNKKIDIDWDDSKRFKFVNDFQNMDKCLCAEKYNMALSTANRLFRRLVEDYNITVNRTHTGPIPMEINWDENKKLEFIEDYKTMTQVKCARKYGISINSARRIFTRLTKIINLKEECETKNEENVTTTKIVSEKKVEPNTSSNIAPQRKAKNLRWVQSTKDKAVVLHNLRKDVLRLEYMIRSEFVISDVFGRIMSTDVFYKNNKKEFYADLSAEIRKAIVRFSGIIIMPNSNSAEDDYKASPAMSPAQAYMYNIFIWMDKKSNHIMNNINSLSELYKSIANSSFVGIPKEYAECLKECIMKDLGISEDRTDAIVHTLDPYFIK